MMTAVKVVQHAGGVGPARMTGGGMLAFIKYDNRAISIALTALMALGIVASATDAF